MGKFLVGKEADISPGGMQKCTVNGLDILIVNADGRYYATDDTCTHAGASLSEGTLKDGCVAVCGWHKAEFDCTTGKLLKFPVTIRDLGSYKVTTESGNLFVET